ncbi:two component transcriptional regulator, LytTR family [Clostridium pasteurianum DSM 525 = ATCC 6013]|uniref:Stage 0 sporulation protein A homolog n=1 Tax=Clostridium pasteurianum DSM 525 = ATCC 6013 TaxID=1262449 RepID=A0A0H3J4Y9_CLOPA|nr:LytTR family DNA-binding domain-containing protein [Clostridium pasteurianum]AJA48574.1 two component transcriptional regulator, LytTR family [Clostridium pasteurianum DSM 525 = ATCC 6013]AJA52562.1 two component transcriptional regulator, LytTR family [Clostridium pasteurianum DSM 525 = ATCC 6013]AOZ75805.1 LytTR family transcriptional regulator [Clostridium pasteurianum DSM 525 = ATCC 6013]AOZ79601.1 LytTR family transcriptional regulator [Clostridium pasteurianum]ELP57948.1 LytTR family 
MKNILVAEDDIKQCENLKKMLYMIDAEFNIHEAQDKDQALKISNNVHIDLFFIDISLKNSSGLELALDLRKISRYEFSWMVFLTTHVEYLTQAFKQAHCYDYIVKPYDKDEIISMIKKFSAHAKNNSVQEKERKSVFLDLKSGVSMKFYIDEIIFIESSMRTCIVNTIRDSYTLKKVSLKNILKLINCNYIIQSYKSFLVNINYIKFIEKIDSRLSELYFEKSSKKALLGYKFKNSVLEKLKGK